MAEIRMVVRLAFFSGGQGLNDSWSCVVELLVHFGSLPISTKGKKKSREMSCRALLNHNLSRLIPYLKPKQRTPHTLSIAC